MTEGTIRDIPRSGRRGSGPNGSAPDRPLALVFMRSLSQDPEFPRLASAMLERDHEVVLVAHEHRRRANAALVDLSARYPRLDHVRMPRRRDPWRIPASATRRALDYLDYLDPEGEDRDAPGAESRERVPRLLRGALLLPPFRWRFGRRTLAWMLRLLEAGLPIAPATKALITERSPAVVVLSGDAGLRSGGRIASLGACRQDSFRASSERGQAGRFGRAARYADPYRRARPGAGERRGPGVPVPRERIHAVGVEVVDGMPLPSPSGVVDSVNEAPRTLDVGKPPGRLFRPVLWLLSPLVILMLLLLIRRDLEGRRQISPPARQAAGHAPAPSAKGTT